MRVPVKNLAAVSPNLSVGLLQEAVGWQFLRTNVQGEDDGYENSRGFQMIRPDNDWFPGLDQLRADFISHQWVFGKTPKFLSETHFNIKIFSSSKTSFKFLPVSQTYSGHRSPRVLRNNCKLRTLYTRCLLQ